jgi:hypothetical protein
MKNKGNVYTTSDDGMQVTDNAASIANTNDYNFGDIIMGGAAHKTDVWTKDSIILKGAETNSITTLSLQANITVGDVNTHSNLNINLNSHSVLTLSGTEYNCTISDPNSTGHIIVNPNLSISSNGSWGTTDQPIGTLTIGNNSTLTLIDHLYVNSLTIDDGDSIMPPEMVHVMGENIDTHL